MKKYIDAEKLIAEIESRMEDCKLPDGTFPTKTNIVRYEELSCLRNFITSHQQEQPEADLDKIIGQTYHDGSVADTPDMDLVDYENIARHFYELGLNARKEETK